MIQIERCRSCKYLKIDDSGDECINESAKEILFVNLNQRLLIKSSINFGCIFYKEREKQDD